jgi:ribose/xylose/arabinose/galactoside ABC-type transport system permease subunit
MSQYQFPPPVAAPPAARPAPRRTDDPLLPHLLWEALLLLGVLVSVGVLLAVGGSAGSSLRLLFTNAVVVGLLASSVAISLRAATPNLAAGSIAAAAGAIAVKVAGAAGGSMIVGGLAAVVIATIIGALVGGAVLALSVPGWAVTFGASILIQGITLWATGAEPLRVPHLSSPSPWLWFPLFMVVTLGGAALWRFVPRVRDLLSTGRHDGDPAAWRLRPGLAAVVALAASSLLAGLAGVLEAEQVGEADPVLSVFPIAFAAALLGGVSIFGRRAGLAGTFLAVLMLGAISEIFAVQGLSANATTVLVGLAILVGLGASRLLELLGTLFGRRQSARPAPPVPVLGTPPPVGPPTGQPPAGPAGTAPAGPPPFQPPAGPPSANQPPPFQPPANQPPTTQPPPAGPPVGPPTGPLPPGPRE